MTDPRQVLGRRGEAVARAHLVRRGIRIVTENFTCPAGEIDLVGRTQDTLIFIEVKTRKTRAFGPPQLAVHQRKQRQIVRTAEWYLAEHRMSDVACRFDVVAVTFSKDEEAPHIDWVQDAFPAEGVRVW